MNPEFLVVPTAVRQPLRAESYRLCEELDQLTGAPDRALVAMQHALGADVSLRIDFDEEGEVRGPAEQFEAIKSFEEFVRTFCSCGILTPRDFGTWLEEPHRELDNYKPLDALFQGFTAEGFDQASLGKVIEVGSAFFGFADGGDVATQELLRY